MKRLLILASLLGVAFATYGNHRRKHRQAGLARPGIPGVPLATEAYLSPVTPFVRDLVLPGLPTADPVWPPV